MFQHTIDLGLLSMQTSKMTRAVGRMETIADFKSSPINQASLKYDTLNLPTPQWIVNFIALLESMGQSYRY